ncbi:exocyst complex component EXO70H1-like [Senna tora]|uniref:Exocyst subunit Exo70 family protein n=1 Tax=Senna tora TaxID=362788 RepID=A0A834W550_9FABA|nr:exocyst complex component EXO70H1-like [Senna tora]
MRNLCFHPKTPSFSISRHSPPSSPSVSTPRRPSSSDSSVSDCIEEAEALILKWNADTSSYAQVTSLFYQHKTEAARYIKCANQLHQAMHLLELDSHKLVLAQNLMQMAMKRLQKEFYQILSMNRAHLDPESVSIRSSRTSISTSDYDEIDADDDDQAAGDSISEVERVSSVAMGDLRSIADCMISSGYAKECVSVYKSIRKSIIDEGIYRLNVEKLSSTQIHKMDWEVVELKIKSWLEALKVSVKTLFNGERILCDHVFGSSEAIRESCFADISRDGATILFRFPELVAQKTKKSPPEKMFRMLDMYSALSALWPEIESIFLFDSTSAIRSQVLTTLVRLSDSVRTMFLEFEATIQKDSSSSRTAISNGGVYPLTTQAMNHLSLLADYSNVLSEMFEDWPPPPKWSLSSSLPEPFQFQDSSDSDELSTTAPSFSTRLAWLILLLLFKLDGKAEHSKDVSLSYLFLANNLHHMIARVRASNLQTVLGYDWVVKHEAKVKRFVTNYENVAWGEVFSSLPENPKAAISLEEAKVIFDNFSFNFEKAYRKQNSFIVADWKLGDEIKGSIARKIVPIYREFYDTHRILAGSLRNMAEYVRFTPDDVENYVSNLFFSGKSSGGGPPSPSSVASSPRR